MLEKIKLGLLDQEKDARDFTSETLGIAPGNTETVIELKLPDFVYNQGQSMMCTAFASTMMMSIINKTTIEFSQADIYAQKSTPGEGAQLRDVMKKLLHRGIAPKMLYDKTGTFEECKAAYAENKDQADFMCELGRLRHYYKAETEGDVVAALELGKPILCGITLFKNFKPDENNIIPFPAGELIGGHAVLIVGHKPGYVKILNSWGKEWGDNGCAWVPYNMIENAYVPVDANMKVKMIYFKIGWDKYVKNGKQHQMDVAPFLKDGRTWVPLRYAAESLDGTVEWLPNGEIIYIKQ